MADATTREALLRLRRVKEMTAQRDLVDARAGVTQAEGADRRARGRVEAANQQLAAARSDERPRSAGRLAARERFVERLREAARIAGERALAAAEQLRDAEARLQLAQKGVETALRAREAAEEQAKALAARSLRQKARREESANNDRWRRRK